MGCTGNFARPFVAVTGRIVAAWFSGVYRQLEIRCTAGQHLLPLFSMAIPAEKQSTDMPRGAETKSRCADRSEQIQQKYGFRYSLPLCKIGEYRPQRWMRLQEYIENLR